jgi:hypothetical protein
MNEEKLIDIAGLAPFAYSVELWHWFVVALIYVISFTLIYAKGTSFRLGLLQFFVLSKKTPFTYAAKRISQLIANPSDASSLHVASATTRNALFLATGIPFHAASSGELKNLSNEKFTDLISLLKGIDEQRFSPYTKASDSEKLLKQLHSTLVRTSQRGDDPS